MSTQAEQVLDAAIASSLANDGGASPIGNDPVELLAALSRKVRQIYSLASLPVNAGGSQSGDLFKTTWSHAVGNPTSTLVALPGNPEIAVIDSVQLADGTDVALVSYRDFLEGRADLAPAMVRIGNALRSPARIGDPAAAAELTIFGSYIPPHLTQVTDYIGALTLTDALTSAWPSGAGDPYLVAYMGLYLALKDATRGADEIQRYREEMKESAVLLASLLDISASALSTTQETPRKYGPTT